MNCSKIKKFLSQKLWIQVSIKRKREETKQELKDTLLQKFPKETLQETLWVYLPHLEKAYNVIESLIQDEWLSLATYEEISHFHLHVINQLTRLRRMLSEVWRTLNKANLGAKTSHIESSITPHLAILYRIIHEDMYSHIERLRKDKDVISPETINSAWSLKDILKINLVDVPALIAELKDIGEQPSTD